MLQTHYISKGEAHHVQGPNIYWHENHYRKSSQGWQKNVSVIWPFAGTPFISLHRTEGSVLFGKLQHFFNVNFDSIERTVRYNEKIFGLDIEAETIYLREPKSIDLLANQYQVDETILSIILSYAA